MNRILFGATVAWAVWAAGGVRAEQVVINEVMYNPRGDAPEWIELSNITATPFDIVGCKLRGDVKFGFLFFDGTRADDASPARWQKIILTDVSLEGRRVGQECSTRRSPDH